MFQKLIKGLSNQRFLVSLTMCGREVLAGLYLSGLSTKPVRVLPGHVVFNQDVTYLMGSNLPCAPRHTHTRAHTHFIGDRKCRGDASVNTMPLFCRFAGSWSQQRRGGLWTAALALCTGWLQGMLFGLAQRSGPGSLRYLWDLNQVCEGCWKHELVSVFFLSCT